MITEAGEHRMDKQHYPTDESLVLLDDSSLFLCLAPVARSQGVHSLINFLSESVALVTSLSLFVGAVCRQAGRMETPVGEKNA